MSNHSPNDRLKLLFVGAIKDFQCLQRLLSGQTTLKTAKGSLDCDESIILGALAHSFVFECNRAYRILDKAGQQRVNLEKPDFKIIKAALKPLVNTRDTIEHRSDQNPNVKNASVSSKHESNSLEVDQSSVDFCSPTEIYQGPHNLFSIYEAVVAAEQKLPWPNDNLGAAGTSEPSTS